MNRLFSLMLTLLLVGCAAMSPLAPTTTELDPAHLGLAESDLVWPDDAWWQRYQDPQLNRLVETALADNPSLAAAQARLAQANAAVAGAQAPLLPRLDANYTLSREHLSGNFTTPAPLGGSVVSINRLALDASYELDFWGRNRARLQAAVSARAASAADVQAARNLLARSVVGSYLNLQNAYAQHEVIARTTVQRNEVGQLTRDRQRAGLDTEVEVRQAESAAAAARVEQTQAEATIAQLRNQLAALTAQSPAQMQNLTPVSLTAPEATLPQVLPLTLLGRRPDVVAARLRAQAAQSRIEAARAEFYPNINIVAFAGLQALGTGMLFDPFSRIAGIGPAVSLPLFHGGELNANLAGRQAEADLVVAEYNQTVLTAVQQTANAVDALRLLEREQRDREQAHNAIARAYDVAVQRYRAGLGNYLSVLLAQDGVLTQSRLLTELRFRAWQLDADLAYALGGGYTPAAPSAP